MKLAIVAGLGLAVSACLGSAPSVSTPPKSDPRAQRLDRHVPGLLREYKAAGASVAIIDHGEVVWTGYYGEQGPGIPASAKTVFNTASVAKTVTAETLLELAAKGLISLEHVLSPGGVSEMSLGRIKPWMAGRLATPMRADGKYVTVSGNGVFVSTQILDLIGDQPEIAAYYRQLVKKFYKVTLPTIER